MFRAKRRHECLYAPQRIGSPAYSRLPSRAHRVTHAKFSSSARVRLCSLRRSSLKKTRKNQKKLKRLDPRRRDGVKPVLLGGRRSRFVVWYAHRLSLLTNSLECCRHSKGRLFERAARRARLSFFFREVKKKTKKRISAPFPSDAASKQG